MNSLLVVVGLSLAISRVAECSLRCLDQSGQPVDWFVAYKLPRIDDAGDSKVREGSAFIYLDAKNEIFRFSETSIRDDQGAVADTLNQFYKAKSNGGGDIAYVLYNDEDPSGHEHFTNGHTKGALAFDDRSGFWMIETVPKLPPYVKDGYSYPHSGLEYGQIFMCVTYNSSTFDEIGYQLRNNNPHIHDSSLPDQLERDFPNIKKAISGDMVDDKPYYSVKHLSSLDGVSFYDFAKTGDFGDDLYAALVAPTLKTDLLAATWQRGTKRLGPSCNDYTVENVKEMTVKVGGSFQFSNEDDHSKFAVSKSDGNPMVCIGDINRMGTQFTRGGGTSCFKNRIVWKQFRNMITGIESC